MAVQLCLAIATAENPKGATRRRTRDRLGVLRAGVPKAIGKAKKAAPATMVVAPDPPHGVMGMIRGRKPAGNGGHNPSSRGAVYDQRTYGSVGAGAGNRPGYPTRAAVALTGRAGVANHATNPALPSIHYPMTTPGTGCELHAQISEKDSDTGQSDASSSGPQSVGTRASRYLFGDHATTPPTAASRYLFGSPVPTPPSGISGTPARLGVTRTCSVVCWRVGSVPAGGSSGAMPRPGIWMIDAGDSPRGAP
jgi:hypothetical protein